jgi:hypothetical protein
MQTHSSSELAAILVHAVAPYLDDDEYRTLCIAAGTEPSQRVVAAVVALTRQRRYALRTDLAGELADRRRPSGCGEPPSEMRTVPGRGRLTRGNTPGSCPAGAPPTGRR